MQGDYHLKKRKTNMDNYNLPDRISELTDELIISILNLLPLKDATATSILSKRWRGVWRYVLVSTRTLNFDSGKTLCSLIDLNRENREQKICRFVDWVNSMVEGHTGPNIKQFRVAFDLDNSFSSSINKWIQFAERKGVQILELDFSEYGIYHRWKACYKIPHDLLGIESGSTSTAVCCGIPTLSAGEYLGFKSLKILDFNYVDVAAEVLEYFLFNCPFLESLTVIESPNLVTLRVGSPSIALKYFVIKQCNNLESIDICDANLVSFSYVGNEISLLIRNVPQLVEVSIFEDCICNNFMEVVFTQFLCCLSQLESLKLNHEMVPYKQDLIFPKLANLKHLELSFEEGDICALLQLTSFMRASPGLHRLVLNVQRDYTTSSRRKIKYKQDQKWSHNCLKVVELVGYDGHGSDFALVRYLAKTAVKLEKIVMKGIQGAVEEERPWRKMTRDVQMKKLKEKVPSTIHLVYSEIQVE